MDIYQLYTIILFVLYFGIVLGFRAFLLYRTTGINPLKGFGKKSKKGFTEKLIQFGLLLMLIIGINYCFLPSNYSYLLPFRFLEIETLNTAGFIIALIGLLVAFIAQIQMRDSWRIGIHDLNKSELITTGLFKYSRNPIYVALLLFFFGFLLLIPNLASLFLFILMVYALHEKIKDEESYLKAVFKNEYAEYTKNVSRWI